MNSASTMADRRTVIEQSRVDGPQQFHLSDGGHGERHAHEVLQLPQVEGTAGVGPGEIAPLSLLLLGRLGLPVDLAEDERQPPTWQHLIDR
jgi:hypothetical protein